MKRLSRKDLKTFLDEKADQFNRPDFIPNDPIFIPHRFSGKQDIEVAGLLSATIAWGNRKSIIKNGLRLMSLMDESPYEFISGYSSSDLKRFKGFCHRTFNSDDLIFFLKSLRSIYKENKSLEEIFYPKKNMESMDAIVHFRKTFLSVTHLKRSEKHISDPSSGSSAKRLNMFLRWMVRKDDRGVDFGIWKNADQSKLSLPLDVHTGRVARELGLLTRKQNDVRAVMEVDSHLRSFDPADPCKYDFALFGLGVEGII